MTYHSNPLKNADFELEYRPSRPMSVPSVFIPAHIHAKIMTWVDEATGEVSGLGKVTQKDGVFTVSEVYLLPQKNSATSTEMDAASVAKLLYDSRETEGHLNYYWHSHVNMDCFWSGTDISTIQDLGKHGWILSTVFNKRREQRSALYIKATDILPEVFIDDIDLKVGSAFYSDRDKWIEEFKEKCKPAYSTPSWSETDWDKFGYGGWHNDTYSPRGGIHSLPLDRPTINPLHENGISLQMIEELAEDFEAEPNAKIATTLLADVCSAIEHHRGLTKKERKNLKREYIERFNFSRKEHKERQGFSQ